MPVDGLGLKPMTWLTGNPVRCLLFSALAALIGALSYRFFFPGYLHPFAIYHDDHFIYQGMSQRGYGIATYFQKYPRPIAHVLVDLCGRLGPSYVMAPAVLLSCLNAGLWATYVERVIGRRIALPFFALFAALAYGNPQFYVQLKADPFAVFALTFLLLIFHSWQSYVESGRIIFWIGTALLVGMFSFTKESYFCTLALFFVIQVWRNGRQRMATLAILILSFGSMAFALHWNASNWLLKIQPATNDTYRTNLSVLSILRGVRLLSKEVFYAPTLASVIAIVIWAWVRSRSVFLWAIASLAFGILAWLPNAVLPNHLELQYACLGIFFVLTPFLLLGSLLPERRGWQISVALTCILVYCLTLLAYEKPARGQARWVAQQELATRNLLAGLARIKGNSKPSESSLVSGIEGPYNPFRVPDFVRGFFGNDRFWTVIVGGGIPESTSGTTRLIHASNPARLQSYAHWFVFGGDERIASIVNRPPPALIASGLTAEQLADALSLAKTVPAMGETTFYASPDPVMAHSGAHPRTTLRWNSPAQHVEIRVGSPSGKLFTEGGSSGEATTGDWLTPDLVFYLQGVESNGPGAGGRTLATLQVHFVK